MEVGVYRVSVLRNSQIFFPTRESLQDGEVRIFQVSIQAAIFFGTITSKDAVTLYSCTNNEDRNEHVSWTVHDIKYN